MVTIHSTIEEFNVDSKAECDQLYLAHVARNKKVQKNKLKQMPVPT